MTSDKVLEALREAVRGTGIWKLVDDVGSWSKTPESIKDRAVRIEPTGFTLLVQGSCRDVTRTWNVLAAVATQRRSPAGTLLAETLTEEDLLVDALLACEPVTDVSGAYSEENESRFQILTLSVTTQSTRPAQR